MSNVERVLNRERNIKQKRERNITYTIFLVWKEFKRDEQKERKKNRENKNREREKEILFEYFILSSSSE